MRSPLRRIARLVLLLPVLVITAAPAPQETGAGDGVGPTAGTEVRLRKLHLVRPDLIPYPIAYEVCC